MMILGFAIGFLCGIAGTFAVVYFWLN